MDRKLEFWPHGGQPESFADVHEEFTLQYRLLGKTRLGDSVYLTWYAVTSDMFDESESTASE